jgi:Domain of unknown function (DUF4062)
MRVFLSSTGRDLKAHRQAAFEAIQGLGMHCVRMEDFHGPAVKIEDFDDRRIAECELFVIVIGHVHGTCPEGRTESYTELEYETAVKLNKPVFLFLAPEDFPLPASMIENDTEQAARLSLDAGNRAEARRHAEIARECAWCDGPPHCYKPALDEAESFLVKTAP